LHALPGGLLLPQAKVPWAGLGGLPPHTAASQINSSVSKVPWIAKANYSQTEQAQQCTPAASKLESHNDCDRVLAWAGYVASACSLIATSVAPLECVTVTV